MLADFPVISCLITLFVTVGSQPYIFLNSIRKTMKITAPLLQLYESLFSNCLDFYYISEEKLRFKLFFLQRLL